jgi:putative redox protein
MGRSMDIFVTFPGGKRVDAAFGGRVIHTDQSSSLGGENSAPSPFDLFLSSLATCAGLYVLGFCRARGISTESLQLVQTDRSEGGRLIGVDIDIRVPADFPVKYLEAVQRAAEGCRVKKTMSDPPQVRVAVSVLPEPTLDLSS